MIAFEDSTQVAAAPTEVFGFIADLDNIPKYQSEVVQSRVVTPGPVRTGTEFQELVRIGPFRVMAHCTVTEYDAESRVIEFKAESRPLRYHGRFHVRSAAGGAQVTIRGTAELRGLWRLFEPVLAQDIRRGLHHELEAIKRQTESARSPQG